MSGFALRDLAVSGDGRLSQAALSKLQDLAYEKVAAERGQTAQELRFFYATAATPEEKAELRAILNRTVKRTVAKTQMKLMAAKKLAESKGLGSVEELEEMEKGADAATKATLHEELDALCAELKEQVKTRGNELWKRARMAIPLVVAVGIFSEIPVAQPLASEPTADEDYSAMPVAACSAVPSGVVVAAEAQATVVEGQGQPPPPYSIAALDTTASAATVAAFRATTFGLPELDLSQTISPDEAREREARVRDVDVGLTGTGWSLKPDSRSLSATVTRAAPPCAERPSWAERQVRKMYGDDAWTTNELYDKTRTQQVAQCATLPPSVITERSLQFMPAHGFLERTEGSLSSAVLQQELTALESQNLGSTGLGLHRYPTANPVDERFKLAYSNDPTEQPSTLLRLPEPEAVVNPPFQALAKLAVGELEVDGRVRQPAKGLSHVVHESRLLPHLPTDPEAALVSA